MPDVPSAVPDLTATAAGLAAVAIFVLAYALVIAEEFTQLRKSKSVLATAGVIWMLAALAWRAQGQEGIEELCATTCSSTRSFCCFCLRR